MRYRTSLLQNKGISSNSTYFRKTIKTNGVLPTSNPNIYGETKDHNSLRKSKSRMAMLFISIGVTICFLQGNMKSDNSNKSRKVTVSKGKMLDPNSIGFSLMLSYPDSYSDYVAESVQTSSGLATAVNYAMDTPGKKYNSIFAMNAGPYLSQNVPLTEHILTSTNCGNWPSDGTPESYFFKTIEIFEKDCFGIQLTNPKTNEIESESVLSQSSVKKVVHLVMNPFTNVISRFTNQMGSVDKNPLNFQSWCESVDTKIAEKESSTFTETEIVLMDHVPCHAEFYRFVSWHNFAFSITRYLGIPAVAINVESFEEDYDGSLERLLSFLEVPVVNKRSQDMVKAQSPFLDDSKYYSTEQRRAIMKLVKRLATEDTWDSLKIYFPDVDVLDNESDKSEAVNTDIITDKTNYVTSKIDEVLKDDTDKVDEEADKSKYVSSEVDEVLKDDTPIDTQTSVHLDKLTKRVEKKTLAYTPKKRIAAGAHLFSMDLASPKVLPFDVKPTTSVDEPEKTLPIGNEDAEKKNVTTAVSQEQEAEKKDDSTSVDATKPVEDEAEIKEAISSIDAIFKNKVKEAKDFAALQSIAVSQKAEPEENVEDVIYYKASEQVTKKESSLTDKEPETEHTDTLYFKAEGVPSPNLETFVEGFMRKDTEDYKEEEKKSGVASFGSSYSTLVKAKDAITTSQGIGNKKDSFDEYLEKLRTEETLHEKKSKIDFLLNSDMDNILETYVEKTIEDEESSSVSQFERLTAPVSSTTGPKVAWLMTFPSSGTTYTSKLIRMASQTTTGSNYGNEYVNKAGLSVPLYSDINGPYIVNETLSVPSTYILTKTHCGSRCVDCSPKEYVETVDEYLEKCLRAPRVVKNTEDTNEIQIAKGVTQSLELVSYDPSVVRKIVHVIKDPFDNIVSRFHHEYKSLVQKFDSKDKFPYSYDKEGFQDFCKDEDKRYLEEEKSVYSEKLQQLSKSVPCHSDFYKYVQWHNLAFGVAEKLNIDSHAINYENYSDKLEETVSGMLNYLELPKVSEEKLAPFKWDAAHDHFSKEQMDAIALFVQELSSDKTWGYLIDYFKDSKLQEERVVEINEVKDTNEKVVEKDVQEDTKTTEEHIKTTEEDSTTEQGTKKLTAPVISTDGPKVAWLMTFPSSGTTYTSKLIRMASQTTTGSNYGNEYVNTYGESVSLYSDINGPYIVNETLSVPSTYILTKTHCGSRCVDCSPKEYVENADEFLEKCLRAPRVKNNVNTKEVQIANGVTQSLEFISYDPSVVRKIVHVIKDPFDNIVSRFHHEYKSLVQKFDSKDKFPYSYDKEGFQEFCIDEDKRYLKEEKSFFSETLLLISKHVPCHADFYKYVQWHNLAFEVAEKLNIESHAINYEDYSGKLEETVSGMLKYLELPKVSEEKLAPFKWDAAHDHFNMPQTNAIALYVQELASEKTWEYLKGYFKDIKLPSETMNVKETGNNDSAIEKVVQVHVKEVKEDSTSEQEIYQDINPVSAPQFERLTAPVISTDGPKVAWLMTFPSSGTTYTSKLIRMASQTTTGSNYGNEYVNTYGESVSLYSDINGPYIVNETLSVPSTYILTKTHCGSRCVDCSPKEYVENADEFLEKCLRAPRVKNNVDTKEVQIANGVTQSLEFVSYDPSVVRKIVHVIKDPFDNIVSRFHHEYKSLVQKFDSKDKFPYSYDKEGFQDFCKDEDKRYLEEEKSAYNQRINLISKHVPCHADFYKYVQWHNLAFEVAEKLNIESHAINYEDYSGKLEETVSGMLKYLELPKVQGKKLAPFKWDAAHDHYNEKQMNAIAIFIQELASDKTWEYLKGYFNNLSSVYRPIEKEIAVSLEGNKNTNNEEAETAKEYVSNIVENVAKSDGSVSVDTFENKGETSDEVETSKDHISNIAENTAEIDSSVGTTEINHEFGVPSETGPKLAWLLTFPNSGTIYTTNQIQSTSGFTTASNYGNEHTNKDGYSIPLYNDTNGPYIINDRLPIPKKYILTKTHCGSRCQDCSPETYIETFKDYIQQCIRAPKVIISSGTGDGALEYLRYEPVLVKKLVHLIKDPLDNIVSRFHYENKYFDRKNEILNPEGFQVFCKDYDKHFIAEDKRTFSPRLLELSLNVPCHGDFYRYVQWHNLAFETADILRIEPYVVHLEEFKDQAEETVSGVLNYLELPKIGPIIPLNWDRTHDHYSEEQFKDIKIFIQELASEKTWSHLRQYFE